MSNSLKLMSSSIKICFLILTMTLALHAEKKPTINIKAIEKILPSTTIKDAFYTEVPGLLGVLLDSDIIIYVYTPKDLIFFGEIYTKDGVNITNEKHSSKNGKDKASGVSSIELSPLMEAGAKISSGDGEYGFIVFTDPDCPYCAQLESFLLKENVDVYNVYTPLDSIHPDAREKSISLLQKHNSISEQKAREKLEMGETIAHGIGVHAAPITIVYKKATNTAVVGINGADLEKFKNYIGGTK